MLKGGDDMLRFNLFRIKVYPKEQGAIWRQRNKSRGELLHEALKMKPSARVWGNTIGSIGDIEPIDDKSIYFRFGKVRKEKQPQYEDGHFFDQIFNTAPYTHVVLDWYLEVCAIALQSRVAPNIESIAKSFCRLLNKSKFARENEIEFEISRINDPSDFLTTIFEAYAVRKFEVTFSRPNVIDPDEYYERPFQNLLKDLNGKHGGLAINTDGDLDREGLARITNAAASKGERVKARLSVDEKSKAKSFKLGDNPLNIDYPDLEDKEKKSEFIQLVRKYYEKVRYGERRTDSD